MSQPTKPAGAERQLLTAVAKLGLALRHESWVRSAPRGLNPTQSQVLAWLARGHGPQLAELARELAVTNATASDAVSALVAKRLVRKARSDDDARALRLELTAAGKREAVRASEWPDAFLAAAGSLSEDEQGVLLRAMTKLVRRLQLEGRIPVARMCATCRFFRPHAYDDPARPHHCDFVGAAFGERGLRLECAEHDPADPEHAREAWARFAGGGTAP